MNWTSLLSNKTIADNVVDGVNQQRVEMLDAAQDFARDQLASVVRNQGELIETLQLVLASLVQVMAESGSLDETVLEATVHEAIESRKAAAVSSNAPPATVTCQQCNSKLALSKANLTGDGYLCDPCANA